jgi:phosphoglycerol transferase MdoB-like AlkP superfamily enzyme
MIPRIWKFTLAWVAIVAIALQSAVPQALAVPLDVGQLTLAAATQLPQPDPKFAGKVGNTYKDSVPSYPQPLEAPEGDPNVLLILLDDVGFGMASTFGGPVPTPNLDKLANNGISYTRFPHNGPCAALPAPPCSPDATTIALALG